MDKTPLSRNYKRQPIVYIVYMAWVLVCENFFFISAERLLAGAGVFLAFSYLLLRKELNRWAHGMYWRNFTFGQVARAYFWLDMNTKAGPT